MQYTERRKKRRKKMRLRRLIGHAVIGLFGVLLLAGIWKVTSAAFTRLQVTETETQEEEITASNPDGSSFRASEKSAVSSENAQSAISEENLLLVNKENSLDEDYEPTLVKMQNYGVEVDRTIYDALNRMLEDGEKEGLKFWVASGYRSPERQRELLDEDIGDLVQQGYSYSEAYEEVVKETMPVGCSEHATGLSVDIVSKGYQLLDSKQADTKEIKWLQENCSRYGFILRYPKDKEEITQVSYESWHFRYVGIDAATEIMEKGITLEEYLEKSGS
jgi:D-alanyl-D-alanine carboxypeptidase